MLIRLTKWSLAFTLVLGTTELSSPCAQEKHFLAHRTEPVPAAPYTWCQTQPRILGLGGAFSGRTVSAPGASGATGGKKWDITFQQAVT